MLIPILTQADADEFLTAIDYLHDALLRELAMLSRGYVTKDRQMFGDVEPTDAWMLFQSQSPDVVAVGLYLQDIRTMVLRPDLPLEPECTVTAEVVTLWLSDQDYRRPAFIECRQISYRLLNANALGSSPILLRDIENLLGQPGPSLGQ